jgi:hypothetical protein
MSITKLMSNMLRTDFQYTDDFQFTFSNANELKTTGDLSPTDLLDICDTNIDTPQMPSSISSTVLGGEYRTHAANFSVFTFSITFRDILGLQLKKYFQEIWMKQQTSYFDDVKSSVKMSVSERIIFESDSCLISDVGTSQFDNGTSNISEFTVSFTSPFMSIDGHKDFGKLTD